MNFQSLKYLFSIRSMIGILLPTILVIVIYALGNPAFAQKVAATFNGTPTQSAATSTALVKNATSAQNVKTAAQIEADRTTKGWVSDFTKLPNGTLSNSDWNYTIGTQVADINNEAQTYTDSSENVRIENSALVIEAKAEAKDGKAYTSARIDTNGKFSFTYGTLEVRMKLPSGTGTWPAAWLLPEKNIYSAADYGISSTDPLASQLNGEIDFMEAIGSLPGQNIPAAHSYNQLKTGVVYTPGFVTNPYSEYHTYGIVKTPTKITFTIDGVAYASRTKTSDSPLDWPYNQPYYLIINIALGGSWAGAQGIDATTAPWVLSVASINYTPLSQQ